MRIRMEHLRQKQVLKLLQHLNVANDYMVGRMFVKRGVHRIWEMGLFQR